VCVPGCTPGFKAGLKHSPYPARPNLINFQFSTPYIDIEHTSPWFVSSSCVYKLIPINLPNAIIFQTQLWFGDSKAPCIPCYMLLWLTVSSILKRTTLPTRIMTNRPCCMWMKLRDLVSWTRFMILMAGRSTLVLHCSCGFHSVEHLRNIQLPHQCGSALGWICWTKTWLSKRTQKNAQLCFQFQSQNIVCWWVQAVSSSRRTSWHQFTSGRFIITLKYERKLRLRRRACRLSWHACVNLSSFALVAGGVLLQSTTSQTLNLNRKEDSNAKHRANFVPNTALELKGILPRKSIRMKNTGLYTDEEPAGMTLTKQWTLTKIHTGWYASRPWYFQEKKKLYEFTLTGMPHVLVCLCESYIPILRPDDVLMRILPF